MVLNLLIVSVMGVDLLNQPIRDLYEAEEILKEFRGVPKLKDY